MEVIPEKDGASEVDVEVLDEGTLELIGSMAGLALEHVVIELMHDVGRMVKTQMTRLYKREVIAAGCRESFESRLSDLALAWRRKACEW